MLVTGDAHFVARDSRIADNVASDSGGAVLAELTAAVELVAVSVANNTATHGGAICAMQGAAVSLTRCHAARHNAFVGGTVFALNSATVRIEHSEVTQASVEVSGGAAYLAMSATLLLVNSTVHGCVANYYGGGIAAAARARVRLFDTRLAFNRAVAGGALCVG